MLVGFTVTCIFLFISYHLKQTGNLSGYSSFEQLQQADATANAGKDSVNVNGVASDEDYVWEIKNKIDKTPSGKTGSVESLPDVVGDPASNSDLTTAVNSAVKRLNRTQQSNAYLESFVSEAGNPRVQSMDSATNAIGEKKNIDKYRPQQQIAKNDQQTFGDVTNVKDAKEVSPSTGAGERRVTGKEESNEHSNLDQVDQAALETGQENLPSILEETLEQKASPGNKSTDAISQLGDYPATKREDGRREKSRELTDLLTTAENHLEELRLATPKGRNAFEIYRSILVRDPGNQIAKRGIARISDKCLEMGSNAVTNGRLESARLFYSKAGEISPSMSATVQQELDRLDEKESSNFPNFFRGKLNDKSFGPEMVLIEAGNFQMGDIQGGGDSGEKPVRRIEIPKSFALGKYEVTFSEYDRFAQASGRMRPNDNGWGRGNRPVVNISWENAKAYTEWLGKQTNKSYRLPTEAEWEYAARAGTKTRYWWGNEASHQYANYGKDVCCDGWKKGDDGWFYTAPVGSLPPNPFGLHEMVGNVWEWTISPYRNSYQTETGTIETNGPVARVARGGSWSLIPQGIRSAYRSGFTPNYRNNAHGFRVARDVE